eukprot:SAG11_NODE_3026_length_2754_cov_2.113371_3_plen_62_part_00
MEGTDHVTNTWAMPKLPHQEYLVTYRTTRTLHFICAGCGEEAPKQYLFTSGLSDMGLPGAY